MRAHWGAWSGGTVLAPPVAFVTRDTASGDLMLSGLRYRFAGNNWPGLGLNEDTPGSPGYGQTIVTAPVAGRSSYALHKSTHSEINDYLNQCDAMNATVIRTFAAMTIGHPLSVQPTLGSFSSANLEPLDYGLQQCALRGIKLILPLTDNYEFFMGGKFDYCRLNGVTPDGTASQFFTNATIINSFKAHISFVLNHVNVYTGVAYKNDPTILAWESGNEIGYGYIPANAAWTESIASYVKSQGAQQLFMDGACYPSTSELAAMGGVEAMPSVDVFTQHPYSSAADTLVQTANVAAVVKAGGRAWVWGEYPPLGYGFPRDFFGNYAALGWTLPGLLSTVESLESDGDLFWAAFPQLEGHEAVFTIHSPGDNPDMVTRVNQLKAHAARMPTLITTELLSDLMTGTNGTLLHNHTADSGSTWVKQASTDGTTAGNGTIQTNRLWFGAEASYVASGQPPTADYDVTETVRVVTAVQNAQVFVNGRGVSGEKTMYRALLLCFNGAYSVSLWRWINGSGAQIGSAAIATPSNGTTHTLVLRMVGDQIRALWDGSTVVGPVTDANIRAAGHPGCGGINSSATTGMHVDSITVT